MYAVLTVDQRHSRRGPDLVPVAIEALAAHKPVLDFERTAGDEIQGVLNDAAATVGCIETLLRAGAWHVGLGVGAIEEPLPDHARAGHGPAYLNARDAVTRAKSGAPYLSVVGADDYHAEQLETVLWLWAGVLGRRTPRGWEVADLVTDGLTYDQAARRLGISQSAVSQRAQAAGLVEGRRAAALAAALLDRLLTTREDA